MCQGTMFLDKSTGLCLHFLIKSVFKVKVVLRASVYFEGKRIWSLHLIVNPIEASAGAGVANFTTCSTKRTLTVPDIKILQNGHHRLLIAVCQMLHVIGPRHIHSSGSTVDSEKCCGFPIDY